MGNRKTHGSIDQMIDAFKARVDELNEPGVESSFDYPEDLIDLENGSYESHATEPINSAVDPVTAEVLQFFRDKLHLDTDDVRVRNYAEAVAEYVDMAREVDSYTLQDWYRDTKMNYPEELEDLPRIDAATCTSNIVTRPKSVQAASDDIDDTLEYQEQFITELANNLTEDDLMISSYKYLSNGNLELVITHSVEDGSDSVDRYTITSNELSYDNSNIEEDADRISKKLIEVSSWG